MNVIDRVESAKHTLTGSGLSKAISKATSHEVIGPKKKHVEFIQGALESGNVSLPDTADMLFERCTNSSWVVVFKSLVTFHHLMSTANERFVQYIASKSATWMLHNFLDKGGVQGYDMSHIVRRYSAYLAEKAFSYRTMGYDFCRIPRGRENGILRNMDTTKLLKALPSIQSLLDALVTTDISSNDLTNGVVTAAFMLLFKDMIRLFACYNDGIINLLEKYFEMKKNDCKNALDLYKKFLARMERVSEFLKVAEDAGIDKGDIPDLTKAPSSLLEALDSHYQSLEKGRSISPPNKPVTLPAFNVEQTTTSSMPTSDNADFLKEQQKLLEMFELKKKEEREREQRIQQQANVIPSPLNPPSQPTRHTHQTQDIYAQPQKQYPAPTSNDRPSDDLLMLSGSTATVNNTLFGSISPTNNMFSNQFNGQQPSNQAFNGQQPANQAFNQNLDFNRAFQSNQSLSTPNLMDDLLTPDRPGQPAFNNNNNNPQQTQDDGRMNGDINKGLERVAMSLDGLNINPNLQKVNTVRGHQWGPAPSNLKTGGNNYQMQGVARSTLPPANYGGMNPVMTPAMSMGTPMYQNQYRPPMQPYGIQQPVMMYGGGYPMMQQQMGGAQYGGMNMMGGYNQRPMMNTNSNINDPFK